MDAPNPEVSAAQSTQTLATLPNLPNLGPAPLWRRVAALAYDSLLLLGLLASGALVAVLLGTAAHVYPLPVWLMRAWVLIIGLGFFGISWTRGGRTPGMLAWRVQIRREDGQALRWPIAAVRYGAACVSWLSVIGVLWSLLDARGRTLHDLIAGTEMVLLPPRNRATHADSATS